MKKIITIIALPLNLLYRLRLKIFLTRGEADRCVQTAYHDCTLAEQEILKHHRATALERQKKFTEGLQGLIAVKMETRRPSYEVYVTIPIAALNTAAGDAAATALIAQEVADRVMARHRKNSAK